MIVHALAISYGICAAVYTFAIALILPSNMQQRYKLLLVVACGLTVAWASAITLASFFDMPPIFASLLVIVFEQMRSASWIAIAGMALIVNYNQKIKWGVGGALLATLLSAIAYSTIVSILDVLGFTISDSLHRGIYLAHVLIAIVALLLVENLFRNSGQETRWSLKYLCFGIGVMMCFDFFVYAEATLMGQLDENLYAARGVTAAISMPLIILFSRRAQSWLIDVHISRKFVFHTATLLSAGLYLIIMAIAGYSLRVFDSPWGAIIQSLFLVFALLLLVVLLCSGATQARLKSFINQNFFTYKYDYRIEWLRFVNSVSDATTVVGLPQRIVQALANIIGSTTGSIWVLREDENAFHATGTWHMRDVPRSIPATAPWLNQLLAHAGVLDIKKRSVKTPDGLHVSLPTWLTGHPQAIVILPLVHAQALIGFVVLGPMRAPEKFSWEDTDLLKIASRHAASYLAEESTAHALAQVKRFEDFNQRFAFIVHDVKNLAAQMTLVVQNAERHADNPAFQKDVLQTVGQTAGRLRGMLEKLKNPRCSLDVPVRIELVSLLQDVANHWKLQFANLNANLPDGTVHIVGHAEQLRAVISHLIQNATDAVNEDGSVGLELHIEGVSHNNDFAEKLDCQWWAIITIADDGPGMEGRFIENNLFQPLQSTKAAGFGIGAFQARQMTRDMGGRLDVESKCGHGTRITVRLPYVPPLESVGHEPTGQQYEPLRKILKSA